MDWETFKRAVDSLKEFPNIVGIMGGEPTLHPQFERFANYLSEQYTPRLSPEVITAPMLPSEFAEKVRVNQRKLYDRICEDGNMKRMGIWSSLPKNYYDNYELIQDLFGQQVLNDHRNDSLHQPLLVSRKDLGISDDEWIPMRDNCWIQNQWSASVTPKGAFFCEVAAALDMLFDGDGGWPIDSEWWKKTPNEFGEQLNWCELCGGALFNKGRFASEGIDDISTTLMSKLKDNNSRKVANKQVQLLLSEESAESIESMEAGQYLKNENDRLADTNSTLCPKSISAIISSPLNLPKNEPFASVIFKTDSDSIGKIVNNLSLKEKDWCFISRSCSDLDVQYIATLKKIILNPGCLYYWKNIEGEPQYLFSFFSQAIRQNGFDTVAQCSSVDDLRQLWESSKQVDISNLFSSTLKTGSLHE